MAANLILCGNLNINYLSNSNGKVHVDLLLTTYGLYNIVDFPARVDKKSTTDIDGIFIIDKCKISNYSIIPIVNGLSDHDAQLLLLNNVTTKVSKGQCYTKRQIIRMNIENFRLTLSFETWDEVFTDGNVDKIFISFLSTYFRAFNSSFPVQKTFQNYNNKAWLTAGIRISCQHRQDLYVLCRSIESPTLLAYYKKYSTILREVMKTAKRHYYSKLIADSNNKSKTIWNIVNNETGKYNKYDPLPLIMDGRKISYGPHIANAFNVYFSTVMENLTNGPNINWESNVNKDNFSHYLFMVTMGSTSELKYAPVTSKDMKDIIKSLKNKNSFGCDEISSKVLKSSMSYVLSPPIYICNRTPPTGILPSRLKYTQVHPIYKKGDRTDITNYRPISFLTTFSKIFEKVIFNRLHTYISVNNILDSDQYGFRTNCSTETAVFNLTNNILQALDSKKMVGGIFCDLTKAFDSVEHERLLEKLKSYGVKGRFF
jgi:hypothetical protein